MATLGVKVFRPGAGDSIAPCDYSLPISLGEGPHKDGSTQDLPMQRILELLSMRILRLTPSVDNPHRTASLAQTRPRGKGPGGEVPRAPTQTLMDFVGLGLVGEFANSGARQIMSAWLWLPANSTLLDVLLS